MDVARELPPAAAKPVSAATTNLIDRVDAALLWCNRQLQRRAVWLVAVLAIITMESALVVTHRAWLDEWQALEIAVQSPDLQALLDNLRYEGHPPLWYLMLRAASLLSPAFALVIVQLPIALALEAVILFKLPLLRIERLLFALNGFVVVDYMAMSRSLGLGVLLFTAAILFRRRRAAWIAIALLPLVDFLFGLLSLICLAVYGRERRLWAPGLVIWLAASAAAAWSVRPAPDLVPAVLATSWWHDFGMELSRFGSVLLPLQAQGGHLQWDSDLPFVIGAPLGAAFLIFGCRLCPGRFSATLFGLFCGLLLVFSIAVYPLSARHLSLAGVLLVVLVALARERKQQRLSALFRIWLAVGASAGLAAAAVNFAEPFDTSAEAAAYIRGHGLETKHWAVYPDFHNQAVSALTGMEFERVELNCTQSFVRWNSRSKIRTFADLQRKLDEISARGGGYYLLTKSDFPAKKLAHPEYYRLLAHIPAGYDGRDYVLYRVRPDLPEAPAEVPQCAPGRLPLQEAVGFRIPQG